MTDKDDLKELMIYLKNINKQLKLRNLIEISKLTAQQYQNYNTLVRELKD